MDFGSALQALKTGQKVARTNWFARGGFWLEMGRVAVVGHEEATIFMVVSDGAKKIWNPAYDDLVSEDWELAE